MKATSPADDQSHINVEQSHLAQYWSEKLNVAQDVLCDAVKAVGTKLEALEKYLEARQFML